MKPSQWGQCRPSFLVDSAKRDRGLYPSGGDSREGLPRLVGRVTRRRTGPRTPAAWASSRWAAVRRGADAGRWRWSDPSSQARSGSHRWLAQMSWTARPASCDRGGRSEVSAFEEQFHAVVRGELHGLGHPRGVGGVVEVGWGRRPGAHAVADGQEERLQHRRAQVHSRRAARSAVLRNKCGALAGCSRPRRRAASTTRRGR